MNFKDNESAQKLRGGYYTDPSIAKFLLRWALNKNPKNILEPSFGDGIFFECLADLNPKKLDTVYGFEIEKSELGVAQDRLNRISNLDTHLYNLDFLDWFLSNPIFPRFDSIVGNPPFIRYQYLEHKQQLLAKEIFKIYDLKFTMHTNAWVPFVIASIALLQPGGRFAFVLPEELLHIIHADSLRKFFASQCSKILIIDPQELWFENTLQGAILVMAEKKEDINSKCKGVSIVQTKSKDFLDTDPETVFQNAEYQNGKVLSGKWMQALLNNEEKAIFQEISNSSGVYVFNEIADVAVGIVTGANNYFVVPNLIVNKYDLQNWAYPMFGRSEQVPNLLYDEEVYRKNQEKGLATNFLWFPPELNFEDYPDSVKEYLLLGEKIGYPNRYKCRIRKPWFSVPSVYSTSVGMLKRSYDFPKLVLNKIEAYTTDTAYRIIPKKFDKNSLVFSFINSLTALSAELEGRHYGGGVLELVPSEIRKLVLPMVQASEADVYNLSSIYFKMHSPEKFIEYQDNHLLEKIGVSKQKTECLRNAWMKLRKRRQRKD